MNHSFARIIAVLALLAFLAAGLPPSLPVAIAEDTDEQAGEIDMETDDDGNGIPDEFETEFRKLLTSMEEMDASDTKLHDIYDSKPYKAIRGFYERLPIQVSTKQGLDEIAGEFQKLAAANSLAKQQKAVEKLQEKQRELIDNDPVYKQAVEYIAAMAPASTGAGAHASTKASAAASGVAGRGDNLSGQSFGRNNVLVQSSLEDLEDEINRMGDVLFRNAADSSSGSAIGFSPAYAMNWSHVGIYSGDNEIYDSSKVDCPDTGDDDDDGVALRPLSEFYDDADDIMYGQLANQSWRWSQAGALEDAQDAYGTDCQIPFTLNVFAMSGTSTFFCSKLVWRTYLDNENYSVNLDSNSFTYYWWLVNNPLWGWVSAWYIVTHTVAPDEIALSSYLDSYYVAEID